MEHPSHRNEDAIHEGTGSASLLPAEDVVASEASPVPAAKTKTVADPKVTVRTLDDGHFAVLIVAPSGAQTDILLDASGRILGIRNVEKPALNE